MRMKEDERKVWKKEDETAFYLLFLKPELSLESFKTICCGGYSVFFCPNLFRLLFLALSRKAIGKALHFITIAFCFLNIMFKVIGRRVFECYIILQFR